MLRTALLHPLRGALAALALGLNTLAVFVAMVPVALAKLVLPESRLRVACDRLLNRLATGWVAFNNLWITAVCRAPWRVGGVDHLRPHGWYLVSSNHRSWVDIFVLQRAFHHRIPFLKFFLKRELIWVPVVGLAWWALDFPFMRRGAGRRDDLATTRRACQRFARIPTAVINFAEGTRFTDAKRSEQRSPYRHLLEPKIAGIGIALATMGELFECLLDVTIVYPAGTPSFWDLLCGRTGEVIVEVQQLPLDAALLGGDLIRDKVYRNGIRTWIDGLWAAKDRRITELLAQSGPAT
ncbi:MAG TPA: acyltransferase [Burkholderiaceae bacterium]|nr:acyltransferase [Burkholderiaceae bacterium]